MEQRDRQRRLVTVRPAVRHLPSRSPDAVPIGDRGSGVTVRGVSNVSATGSSTTGSSATGSAAAAALPASGTGLFGRPRPPVPAMAEMPPSLAGRALAAATAAQVGIRAMPATPVRAVYSPAVAARAFNVPNLRRNVCPHFYVTGPRGALPVQAPHLLKALIRQESTISRCQLRGGVHLDQGYINDVCMTPRFNQCVFYEDGLGDR